LSYKSGETNDLAIKAPEWNELPDDYGDPRVWMEADEVTEDGEFFYITGSSNIIEGAMVKAEYGNNNSEANILPDGTFEMKLDYKELLLLFHPAKYNQYNEIHETYGEEGQKLVGDLVTKHDYSNEQYIEKVVDWSESSSELKNEENNDEDVNEEDEENEDDD